MSDKSKHCLEDGFFGTSTVGERGQVVIPADAREQLGIQAGDKLMVMRHPIYDGVMLFKIDAARGFIDEFCKTLDKAEQAVGGNS